ncbi:MAG: hypothetical protein EOP84_05205 [Verrucomicrobiaceae bacterium]|nr:MAG: hypothetical protein EOP84_05205 [Verrucomicrobiaceae bacterium]
MGTPNEELVQRISAALQKTGLALPDEIYKVSKKALSGKVKPEDWYALFENSLEKQVAGGTDGS